MLLWQCFSLPVGGRVTGIDGPGSEGGVHPAHDLAGKGILLREPREHLQGEGRERKEGGGERKREGSSLVPRPTPFFVLRFVFSIIHTEAEV